MNVTVRQLRAFVAVAQLGGFSAAATRLHLTQSALSMLVRSLEEEIGLSLFERTTRSVKLTDAGHDFLPQAEKMLTDLHNAVAATRMHAERSQGRLVVAVPATFASTLLPELLGVYRKDNPDVLVQLVDVVTPRQIRELVHSAQVDIGIAPLEASERSGFVVDVLMDDELMLACPAGHELARRDSVSWGDLAHAPYICFARDNALQHLVEQSLAASGVRLRPRYEVVSMFTAAALVAQGLGVTVLPSYARNLRPGDDVRYLPLVDPVVKRDLCILRLSDRAMSPAAQRFVDVVLARTR